MIVTDLYSSAQYVVDENGNKKAVLDWQIWKDIVGLLKKLENREVDLTTDALHLRSGVTPLIIKPDAEQAIANQAALALLHNLDKTGDEQEQRQTWAYLQRALDEDRLSNRPLFPQIQ